MPMIETETVSSLFVATKCDPTIVEFPKEGIFSRTLLLLSIRRNRLSSVAHSRVLRTLGWDGFFGDASCARKHLIHTLPALSLPVMSGRHCTCSAPVSMSRPHF